MIRLAKMDRLLRAKLKDLEASEPGYSRRLIEQLIAAKYRSGDTIAAVPGRIEGDWARLPGSERSKLD
jgi:hypothetical protein